MATHAPGELQSRWFLQASGPRGSVQVPPDMGERAVETVIKQAELLAAEWAA